MERCWEENGGKSQTSGGQREQGLNTPWGLLQDADAAPGSTAAVVRRARSTRGGQMKRGKRGLDAGEPRWGEVGLPWAENG